MTKDWCEQKKKEYIQNFIELQMKILESVDVLNLTTNQEKYIKELIVKKPYLVDAYTLMDLNVDKQTAKDWFENNNFKKYEKENSYFFTKKDSFFEYLDTEKIELDGDVLITDPCYIVDDDDDWERSDYGKHFEKIGITNFVTHDTIYGDWSCSMFDTETDEKVGDFCADAGMVTIISLDQAMNYNKTGVKALLKKDWCATIVKNFKGTGQIKIKEVQWEDKETKELHTDYEAYVELIGIDKTTNKNVKYISKQTGF